MTQSEEQLLHSAAYAQEQDKLDTLAGFRTRFYFPKHEGAEVRYFCGNSLGLQPRSVRYLINQELEDWAEHGVEGHIRARHPWLTYHKLFSKSLAAIVGANESEVVAMNTLTVNLNLLLLTFYRPTKTRYKILMEAGAFPSDQYAVEMQVRSHGFAPDDAIIEVAPREGAHTIDDEDLLNAIREAGESLAVVMIGGVNYYTGQLFDMQAITAAAHEVGAFVGFDLAHAVGNVPLALHDWDVDFACWCTYKYLNSGPGAVGGVYVHDRWGQNPDTVRLAGWWGHNEEERFKMYKGYQPMSGAAGWQMSNAPVFNMVAHLASLDLFDKAGMASLREKSLRLTAYLETLLRDMTHLPFEIITPTNPAQRGAQLSLLFAERGREVFDKLTNQGIVVDWREPNVIRMAPVPMYNSFADVQAFCAALAAIR